MTKTYNANNQQTGTGYVHDNNGNPTTYSSVTLTFDPENRMTSYGSVLTAGYRGDGLRAWKESATVRTYFLYDGILPILEMDSSGSITATTSFAAFGLVSRREGSASVFYTFDSEGNVAQRSDATGTVLSNHLLDSHGAIRSGALSEPFGYKGQFGYYTDHETGLQLLTQRYYDPNTGSFLTRDPIGYAGGIGLYSYVTNNPVSWIDVEGRQKKAIPRQPPDDVYIRALKKIADATGGTLNPNWKITPGNMSYNDAIRGLKRMGFKKFFNPNIPHLGGSDWEGMIDGNWYHVTVGYPPLRYGIFVPSYDCASPKFVDAHYERFQPSSMEHLIDYLSPSLAPLIPTIMSGLPR